MAQRIPTESDMAPEFVLTSTTGKPHQLSSYRGQHPLVLVFAGRGEHTGAWLQALAARSDEITEEEAVVLVVVRGDIHIASALAKRDHYSFISLADPDGSVHQRYGVECKPALFLTDRYGEIYGVWREQLPNADEVIASLAHINAACPE